MNISGERTIMASKDAVWAALNDVAVLQQCIPGCQSVEKVSDTEFTATVVLTIGPMKAKFNGKVTLSDLNPPDGCKITGEGQGGIAGFGSGGAIVKLTEGEGATTVLSYTAEAAVGGKIAQLGARLIESTARKLSDKFFDSFARVVGGQNSELAQGA
jgi:carbon monoxide dehydrogenase subunit G